jgi:hypothetical protein
LIFCRVSCLPFSRFWFKQAFKSSKIFNSKHFKFFQFTSKPIKTPIHFTSQLTPSKLLSKIPRSSNFIIKSPFTIQQFHLNPFQIFFLARFNTNSFLSRNFPPPSLEPLNKSLSKSVKSINLTTKIIGWKFLKGESRALFRRARFRMKFLLVSKIVDDV